MFSVLLVVLCFASRVAVGESNIIWSLHSTYGVPTVAQSSLSIVCVAGQCVQGISNTTSTSYSKVSFVNYIC